MHPKDGTGTRNVVPEVQSQSQEGAEHELLFNKPQGGGCQPRPVARQGAFGEVSRRFSSSLLGLGGGGVTDTWWVDVLQGGERPLWPVSAVQVSTAYADQTQGASMVAVARWRWTSRFCASRGLVCLALNFS